MSAAANKYMAMQDKLEKGLDDLNKAVGGNKAATTRVRKLMQEIKGLAQEVRKDIMPAKA